MKHASIIPLIGGETIGSERAMGTPPSYFLSYEAFWGNDKHVVNHYGSVPYYVLDKGERPKGKVDVVSSVCPCAGLSQLSHGFGDDNKANDWMPIAANYVMGELKPKVYWGENAPGLAGKIGQNVRKKLIEIGRENGYTATFYRTRSLLHGIPQIRERSFYFFWRGDKTPLLEYYNRPYQTIQDLITSVKSNSQMETINSKTPSVDDPYYTYILEEIHGGVSHREFAANIITPTTARGNDVLCYIENHGHSYDQVAAWLRARGNEREALKCERRRDKLASGGNIMRRGTMVPCDYIGAFVGHYPTCLTHPVQDRYITYREAMSIMGLPENFELLEPKKSVNHICQNVPVQTAQDMAEEVKQVLLGNRPFIDAPVVFQYNHSQKHEVETSPSQTLEDLIAA